MKIKNQSKYIFLILLTQSTVFYFMWVYYHGPTNSFILENTETKYRHDLFIRQKAESQEQNNVQKCKLVKRKEVDCQKLFKSDSEAIQHAKIQKYTHIPEECHLEIIVKNCDLLIKAHGYINHHISGEERDFPLAFTIKMHKNPYQAEQLLRTIYRPHNVYCIYVDVKAKVETYDVMRNLGQCFSNVYVVKERDKVIYSSIDLVKAELVCMRKLTDSNVRWKYYINLTGQEFPLRTNLEIIRILKGLRGANDIESYDYPNSQRKRFNTIYVPKGDFLVASNRTKPPFEFKIDMRKGSAYGMFHYDFIQFILRDDIALEFLTWLYESYAPEECVFSTLNALPWAPGGYTLEVRHDKDTFLSRAMLWSWDPVKCKGQYVRSVCTYGPEDLQWLIGRPEMIANKFDMEYDTTSIDCMEELIRNRTETPHINFLNWFYYNNLPHSRFYASLNKSKTSSKYLSEQKKVWIKERKVPK